VTPQEYEAADTTLLTAAMKLHAAYSMKLLAITPSVVFGLLVRQVRMSAVPYQGLSAATPPSAS